MSNTRSLSIAAMTLSMLGAVGQDIQSSKQDIGGYIPNKLNRSKYKPSQGAKECARRVRQANNG